MCQNASVRFLGLNKYFTVKVIENTTQIQLNQHPEKGLLDSYLPSHS